MHYRQTKIFKNNFVFFFIGSLNKSHEIHSSRTIAAVAFNFILKVGDAPTHVYATAEHNEGSVRAPARFIYDDATAQPV